MAKKPTGCLSLIIPHFTESCTKKYAGSGCVSPHGHARCCVCFWLAALALAISIRALVCVCARACVCAWGGGGINAVGVAMVCV